MNSNRGIVANQTLRRNFTIQEECQHSYDDAEASLKTAQKVAGALRRAIMDMKKMRRALEKMRRSEKTRQALNAKAEKAMEGDVENRLAKCLGGRTAISKAVTMSDPLVIQNFKEFQSKKEMKVCKDPLKELCAGMSDAARPFCVRKGRHVLRLLVKNEESRLVFERTIHCFKEQCMASSSQKSLPLNKIVQNMLSMNMAEIV